MQEHSALSFALALCCIVFRFEPLPGELPWLAQLVVGSSVLGLNPTKGFPFSRPGCD